MMPRPSKKQQAENRAPVPVPAQPQQHMIPQVPQPQGIPLQMQQPLPHQGQLAVGAPPPQVHGRVVDNESFLRVRDSVSNPDFIFNHISSPVHSDHCTPPLMQDRALGL